MSAAGPGVLASLLDRAAPRDRPILDDRLWPALAHPTRRQPPLRTWDIFGERFRGAYARARGGRALRPAARAIITHARALCGLDEPSFTGRIDEARRLAAVDRAAAVGPCFAVAWEAVRREIGLSLYEEQVMAALAMARGACAELATGEGKTLTAILPAALDGWSGRGVHIITVNDYLARRDAATTQPAYRRLGLSVGFLQDAMTPIQRRRAYACDITYAADKQAIFDLLRDRLAAPLSPRLAGVLLDDLSGPAGSAWTRRIVQRGLHAAIIDEADSILIDEAITPALIAHDLSPGAEPPGAAPENSRRTHFHIAARIAHGLSPGEHYHVDRRLHRVRLEEAGRARLAELAESLPPFWSGPRRREELALQALTAKELYRRGDEYIIRDGKVVIVDRSTGRVLEGRQWHLGLHQAVEAKEELDVTDERRTTARISYQRFFQQYRRLSGMTGTAREVRHELWRFYRLPVVCVPTHRPVIRIHTPDRVFTTEAEKFDAVAARTAELHAGGRPVLVGTRSVASSERLASLLADRAVPSRILNATREAEEAAIVAEAGTLGAVTVATNMAGRGTDIRPEPRALSLGGLVVIATERHDEARVDRQLFGRSGRQGDPGRAETFVSLEDALIRRHGPAPLVWLVARTRGGNRAARLATSLLWRAAQWSAGRKAAVLRSESSKADSYLDIAMHQQTR